LESKKYRAKGENSKVGLGNALQNTISEKVNNTRAEMKRACSSVCHCLPKPYPRKDTYSSDKDNGLKTLTENGNQREKKHGIATGSVTETLLVLVIHGLGKLDLPLFLNLGGTEHGHTHDRDHDHGNEREHADPDTFTAGPQVVTILVPITLNKSCDSKQKKMANGIVC
jgi:hypothetical protein